LAYLLLDFLVSVYEVGFFVYGNFAKIRGLLLDNLFTREKGFTKEIADGEGGKGLF
jgi:hypothetical protein